MRRVVCLLVAAVCAVALASCGESAEPTPIEQDKQNESSGGGDNKETPAAEETPADNANAGTLEAMPKAELQAELDTFFADFYKAMEMAIETGQTDGARRFCEQTVKPCWGELDGLKQVYADGGKVLLDEGYGEPDVFVTFVKGDQVKVDVEVHTPAGQTEFGDGTIKPLQNQIGYFVFSLERRDGELIMTSGYGEEK